ncbi:C4-dicarboxylate transporter DctA [Acinetobacter sp. HY1485]|uniref:C4-dicarboxylate transporter DctA n=1 Tax=Acinetobacter sp. HY1485 TaxID=2970918 RepID=UPI0022B9750F|nr:C4-dicarboxylate transporter DctA [Acinetobacter sp. HY1485]
MQKIKNSLFLQVIIAAGIGILLGINAPQFSISLQILGDSFIRLIKMLIAPLIFCVIVTGIYNVGDLKKAGKVGLKTLIYFELMTTIALVLGVVVAYIFNPGQGMKIDLHTLDSSHLNQYTDHIHAVNNISDFILNIIPQSAMGAFINGDVLQVIVFAIIFGCALSCLPQDVKQPVASLLDKISQIIFKMMAIIIKLAPLGVMGAVAYTIAKYGIGSLSHLLYFVLIYYVAIFFFVFAILGSVLYLFGFNIFKVISYFKEELLVVLGTASSDAVLPQVMDKLNKLGVQSNIVSLVIPAGYSFNLDGFSIYLTLAVVFIAQATGVNLSLHDLAILLVIAVFTSKGAHGIPASAIVVLAATLSSFPAIPAVGLVLILSVDWFVGMVRAASNLVGNCVATLVIASMEKEINYTEAHLVLTIPKKEKVLTPL